MKASILEVFLYKKYFLKKSKYLTPPQFNYCEEEIMKNKQFYTITNDIIFKLSLQKNLEALHKLCTIFIKDLKDEVYNPDEIKIEKTDLSSLEFKSSILDVRFEILNKYSLDFEMQKYKPSYLLEDRMLKYHAELIVRSYHLILLYIVFLITCQSILNK